MPGGRRRIVHGRSGRQTTFGRVAAAAARLAAPDVKLKDPKDWKLIGKRLARLDTVEKTTGALVYGTDLKLPGLLNAAIRACPVFGGKLKRFDAAAVQSRPACEGGGGGRQRGGGGGRHLVAGEVRARRAARRVGPGRACRRQLGGVCADPAAALEADSAVVGTAQGDARAALAAAPRRISAVYSYPHQNHATMEVMNATVRWTSERCEVWTPTQNGEAALAATAAAAGLPPAQCEVYKLPLGGGFGRRGAVHDWVRQAVLIARELPGTPVKLTWSREEDMTHGAYHPVTMCRLSAGLDAQGRITGAAHAHRRAVHPGRGVPAERCARGATRWCSRA
jgi:isoquinoline 1-oxidoreductase beta subunit